MNEPFVRLIYFFAMVPLTSLAFRWIFQLALLSAGLTSYDVLDYLSEIRHSKHRGRYLDSFIVNSSSDSHRTSKLLAFYHLRTLIIAFCIFLPAMGIRIQSLDTVLRWGAVIIPVIIVAVGIGGYIYCQKRELTLPSLREDFAALGKVLYKNEVQPFRQSGGSYTAGCLKGLLVVGIMVGIFFLIIHAAYNPMTPATAKSAEAAMSANGCYVIDLTADTREAWSAGDALTLAIAGEDGSVRADFFIFDTDDRARNVCSQYLDLIRERSGAGEVFEQNQANYYIYTITGTETYYALYCVDNTLFYAYAPKEQAETVRNILRGMGYLDD